ncbi:hypothetical protein CKM354_000942800 [Cercospora kikuchii]|uniref:Micro-fibrillar-associated protein 1 C-terminal domain-containing protein n=1 Tax=Cercospora kikuchii TaxID=84275 RepID=A0A9P3CP18_9PEZI|nr:uncharacterized protein CKM354_000942800 [Cercospora kikuchii]GIZ46298.1 hypothetical protein CKM354_000942800 [Cercospora kikuchii]
MPPPSSRMTKQPVRPARFFPGKAVAEDPDSDEEDSEDEEDEQPAPKAPAPKATSFPKKLAIGEVKPAPKAPEQKPEAPDLDGFVTASESEEDDEEGSGSEDDSSEEEEDSSSDDEPKKPMLAPKFISKAKRAQQNTPAVSEEQKAAEEERLRKEKADALLQAQIEREIALKKAGKKNWDDDDVPQDEVDDTDGLDPEAERAAWKLRELKRVQRDRNALIEKEKILEEIERRRNMTEEERAAEDAEKIAKQEEEREQRGQMGHMQKYFHKGAFFDPDAEQDEEVKAALTRSIAGRKFVDEASDKTVLPEYMQIRDATKLGKKGRTKYKDLKNEDTGRWGTDIGRKKRDYDGLDDRFKPDEGRGSAYDSTGANSAPLGERRRREDDGGRDEKRPRYD